MGSFYTDMSAFKRGMRLLKKESPLTYAVWDKKFNLAKLNSTLEEMQKFSSQWDTLTYGDKRNMAKGLGIDVDSSEYSEGGEVIQEISTHKAVRNGDKIDIVLKGIQYEDLNIADEKLYSIPAEQEDDLLSIFDNLEETNRVLRAEAQSEFYSGGGETGDWISYTGKSYAPKSVKYHKTSRGAKMRMNKLMDMEDVSSAGTMTRNEYESATFEGGGEVKWEDLKPNYKNRPHGGGMFYEHGDFYIFPPIVGDDGYSVKHLKSEKEKRFDTKEEVLSYLNNNTYSGGGTVIEKGNRVRVVNTQYDGKEGLVVSNDLHDGQYQVQVDGKVKGFPFENLMLLSRETYSGGGEVEELSEKGVVWDNVLEFAFRKLDNNLVKNKYEEPKTSSTNRIFSSVAKKLSKQNPFTNPNGVTISRDILKKAYYDDIKQTLIRQGKNDSDNVGNYWRNFAVNSDELKEYIGGKTYAEGGEIGTYFFQFYNGTDESGGDNIGRARVEAKDLYSALILAESDFEKRESEKASEYRKGGNYMQVQTTKGILLYSDKDGWTDAQLNPVNENEYSQGGSTYAEGGEIRSAVRWAKGDIIENDYQTEQDVNIIERLEDSGSQLYKVRQKLGIHSADEWEDIYEKAFEDTENAYGIPSEYESYVDDSIFGSTYAGGGEIKGKYIVFYTKDGGMRERMFDSNEKDKADEFALSVNSEAIKMEDGGEIPSSMRAIESRLKDSGFNHHKGSPKNELKHNRGQHIAVITDGKVYMTRYTPNTKRHLDSRTLSSMKEVREYLDNSNLYAKGGSTYAGGGVILTYDKPNRFINLTNVKSKDDFNKLINFYKENASSVQYEHESEINRNGQWIVAVKYKGNDDFIVNNFSSKKEAKELLNHYQNMKDVDFVNLFELDSPTYAGGGEIGVNSIIEFRHGRDGQIRTGQITREINDGEYEVFSGTRQMLVRNDKIIGLAPERRKRFGIFDGGGDVMEEETVWQRGNWAITRKGSGRDATYYADNGERSVYTEVDSDGDVTFDDDLPVHVQERVKDFYQESSEEPFDRWQDEALWELREEESADEMSITDEDSEYIEIEGDTGDYIVFEDEDEAEKYAIKRVAEDLEENPEYFTQDWLMNYIDAGNFFKDAYLEWDTSYAEDIKSESSNDYPNRLIEEMVERGIMSEEDAQGDDADEIADDRIDTFAHMMSDEKMDEGSDGYEYYKSNFGEQQAGEILSQHGLLDIGSASVDAVNSDGIGHFLSGYDGKMIELSSGAVAFRTN